MKKIFLLFALALINLGVFAQKTKFGVVAGATFATQKISNEAIAIDGSAKVGVTLGGTVDIELAENFHIQPGLNFTQKNSEFSAFGESLTRNLSYVEIPLNLLYNLEVGSGKIFAGAGPTLGFGVSGKNKSGSVSESIKWGSGEDNDLKAFDFGLNLLAGYELTQGITIGLNYNIGLANLAPVTEGGTKYKINYFGIRLGYKFNGK
jgi:hypothetical protein